MRGGLGKGARNRDKVTQSDAQQKITQRSGSTNPTQLNVKIIGKTRAVIQMMGARVRFNFKHVRNYEGRGGKGILKGGHDINEFMRGLAINGGQIVSRKPHPTIRGVEFIEYRSGQLKPGTQELNGNLGAKVHFKTVYDPSIIPHQTMARWGRQAFRNALIRHGGNPPDAWSGRASNGIEITGHWDSSTGTVSTFFVQRW